MYTVPGLWPFRIGLAIAIVLIGGVRVPLHAQESIQGVVAWQPPSGEIRNLIFQGTLQGASLQGTLDDGEKPVTVAATVASDGTLYGSILDQDGTVVGTFGTPPQGGVTDPEAPVIVGSYTFNGVGNGGGWAAAEVPPPH